MSASLVGSEMCIRDRQAGATYAGGGVGGPPETGFRPGGHGSLETQRGAVSYTHLTLPTICSV
eukprot:1533911-Alexandrium_andersonii.AAC.1